MSLLKKVFTNGRLVVIVVAVILLVDQVIKIWVKTNMCLHESIRITSWFYINYIENMGMAFGMQLGSKIILSVFRVVAIAILIYYIWKQVKAHARTSYVLCLSMILGGAIGNLVDCMFYGLCFAGSSEYYTYIYNNMYDLSPHHVSSFASCLNVISLISFLKNNNNSTTPTLMHASAKLNTGLKNTKWLPPMIGIQSGHSVSINGK